MRKQLFIVDDDEDDRQMLQQVLVAAAIDNPVVFINDGVELLERLKLMEKDEEKDLSSVVLLDLNMPKMSGIDVIKVMKDNPEWKKIPVIIFSTSDYAKDIEECYLSGASSYIVKPLGYARLVAIFKAIKGFWLDTVMLPGQ